MSSRNETPSTGSRIRPISWAIAAWMIIMIAAIVGAWQGSEARYGALPEVTVASDRGQVTVLPFTATDLDGNTFTNPVGEFRVQDEDVLTVRLPGELRASTMDVYEIRADGSRDYTVEAGGPGQLLVPVTTPEEGRIEGLAIRAVAIVYAADGSESILNGEWSVRFTYAD